jgi:glycosyltransferase involved in cell wall biosynthesis
MRIGIEAQRIFRSKKHGMDIVALELIKALQAVDKENRYFIFVKKGDDKCLAETENFKIIEVPGITYADWEQFFLPIYARKCKLDILHCTSNTAPLGYSGKSVVTLHDVIFLENKANSSNFSWYQNMGRIYRRSIVPASIKKANRIITVSEYEKNQILLKLMLNPGSVDVIYNAFGNHFNSGIETDAISKVLKRYNLPDHYIFYIGNTDPKKNIYNTIRAYRAYCIGSVDPLPLVIADIDEVFLARVLEKTNTKSLRKNIVLTGYIFNPDLPAIYSGSDLFLYPSLRESFGIPLLEAMACSTPVITSNTSALPEIAGDAALLVDPANEKSIGNAMMTLLSDENLAKELVSNGLRRSKLFNWNVSAINLLNIYKTA